LSPRDMKIPDQKSIDAEILAVGSVDYLDVWFIAGTVKRLVPAADEDEVRELCLDALERLMESGRVEAGDLHPPGEFSPWPFDVNEAMERIKTEWEELDRPLQPGDIAWFEVVEPRA
jgi:hypothetical protein